MSELVQTITEMELGRMPQPQHHHVQFNLKYQARGHKYIETITQMAQLPYW